MEETADERIWIDELANSIKSELEIFLTPPPTTPPPVTNASVLHRVPEDMKKKLNPKAYEPSLISIGPIYYGRSEFRATEEFKRRYAAKYFSRCRKSVELVLRDIKEFEPLLRHDYGIVSNQFSSQEFMKIMLIDGAFLIEFLIRLYVSQYEEIDRMSQKKWKNITSDLLLLENQIPLPFLNELFKCLDSTTHSLGLGDLLKQFFTETLSLHPAKVDFIRSFCFFQVITRSNFLRERDFLRDVHLLDCVRNIMKPRRKPIYRGGEGDSNTLPLPSCPTISQLHRAGVKFRRTSTRSYFDMRFRRARGVLKIPPLNINDNTATLFANLIALEQCRGGGDCYVTDYVAMMDYLIDLPEDVELLVQHGIIENSLKDAAASLINELGNRIDVHSDFYYSRLVEDLNAYTETKWARWNSKFLFDWKMDLKRNYCSSPWKSLSVIAAIILLLLTIIQTVFSYLQLKQR